VESLLIDVVTGIGAAVAKAFATSGCKCIAITDINASKLEQTREEIAVINADVVVLTAAGDIADERFVNAFINSVISETGRIDYAVRLPSITFSNKETDLKR
jgi:NAD(P)-dependent dehydrogenase (short-subunit alcohol dehydrogenase family)